MDLQLRALAAPEATAANGERRRFPFPVRLRMRIRFEDSAQAQFAEHDEVVI
jgi:hypothetical protein